MIVIRICLATVVAVGFEIAVNAEEPPSVEQVRAAVEKSLPVLAEKSEAWWNERKCASCHHGPMLLFSHQEARRRGVAFDAAKLDSLTDEWVLKFCRENENMGTKDGGGADGFAFTLLSHSRNLPDDPRRAAYDDLARIATKLQKEDGSWDQKPRTAWMAIALRSFENDSQETAETVQSAASARQRADAWLATLTSEAPPATEELAAYLAWKAGSGDEAGKQTLAAELLGRQNPDGGWGIEKDQPSHVLVTGVALYALRHAGEAADQPALGRAAAFLLSKQDAVGAWPESGRARGKGKQHDVYTYWASAWATVGLLQLLPSS